MKTFEKLAVWSHVVIFCIVSGLSLGMACDRLLWEWSYDYVFPAHYCRNGGLRLGCLLGTIVAAAATVGSRPLPHLRWTMMSGIGTLIAMMLMAVAAATVAWCWSKYGGHHTPDGGVPLSRMAFCSELVRGGTYSAWIAALGWVVALWRHRKSLTIPINYVSLPTGDQ